MRTYETKRAGWERALERSGELRRLRGGERTLLERGSLAVLFAARTARIDRCGWTGRAAVAAATLGGLLAAAALAVSAKGVAWPALAALFAVSGVRLAGRGLAHRLRRRRRVYEDLFESDLAPAAL